MSCRQAPEWTSCKQSYENIIILNTPNSSTHRHQTSKPNIVPLSLSVLASENTNTIQHPNDSICVTAHPHERAKAVPSSFSNRNSHLVDLSSKENYPSNSPPTPTTAKR
jgi:hypothetical protein